MTAPGWEGILDDDERILWQGRPDPALVLEARNIMLALFGLFFGGFALFWIIGAASQGGPLFALFGLPHFLVGAGMVWGAIWWPSFRRRRSWYTLTDRRAFIATDLPIQGRRLQSWPINRGTRLELREGPPDSVFFATRKKRSRNGTYTVPVGFERIPDGKQVLRLMRDIQKGAA